MIEVNLPSERKRVRLKRFTDAVTNDLTVVRYTEEKGINYEK